MEDGLRSSEDGFGIHSVKDLDLFGRNKGARDPKRKSYLTEDPEYFFARNECITERESYSSLGRFVEPSCSLL